MSTCVSNLNEKEQEINVFEHSTFQSPETENIIQEVSDSTPLSETTARELIALLRIAMEQGKFLLFMCYFIC